MIGQTQYDTAGKRIYDKELHHGILTGEGHGAGTGHAGAGGAHHDGTHAHGGEHHADVHGEGTNPTHETEKHSSEQGVEGPHHE